MVPAAAAGPASPGCCGAAHRPHRWLLLRRVAVGSVMQTVMGIAIYGFVAWVPTFLVQHGIAINRSLGQSVLMSLGGPAGAALAWLLTDRVGRTPSVDHRRLLARGRLRPGLRPRALAGGGRGPGLRHVHADLLSRLGHRCWLRAGAVPHGCPDARQRHCQHRQPLDDVFRAVRRGGAVWRGRRVTATTSTVLQACAMSAKGRAPALLAEQMLELEGLVLTGPDWAGPEAERRGQVALRGPAVADQGAFRGGTA